MANDDPFADIGAKPSDDPFADIKPAPSYGRMAWDVAKQIPSGLVAGTEAVATFPAQVAGLVAPLAERYAPAWLSDPEADKQQAEFRAELAKGRRGIADYLPKPETTVGKYARTASEFIPSVVAGSRLALPRAAGVGATAGVVSEAAGQATEGTEAEPYARVGAALVGGVGAGRLAEGPAARAAVKNSIAATEAAGDRGFKQFRASGFTLDPVTAKTYTVPLKADLTSSGLTPRTADRTWAVLDDIERKPYTTATQFQERYKELGKVAKKATDNEERLAANIAQQRLLQSLDNPPAWVVQGGDPAAGAALLRNANADWAAAQRAKNVDRRILKGEQVAAGQHSGLGLENELRRRIGVLADPNVRGGFSEAEQQAFKQYGKGTNLQNFRRWAMNLGGGRGGIAATVAGGGAGFGLGSDPITGTAYGVGVPLAALGLAKYGNMRALNRARELELMLLARSPHARAAGMPGTQYGGVRTLAAPSLAQLGED